MFGPRTKKINTYGKKRVGVISLYSDNQAWSPARNETSAGDKAEPASPVQQRRAPLTSKLSSDANTTVGAVPPVERAKSKAKAKAKALAKEEGFFADDNDDLVSQKASAPKAKKASKPASKAKAQKEWMDCVEIPCTPRPRARARAVRSPTEVAIEVEVEDVTEGLSNTSINPAAAPEPEVDHDTDHARLLASCTITHEHDFSSFLTSPAVLALLDPSQAPEPHFRKVGEASYSEVFAMRIRDDKDIVVKVIPLFDHRPSSSDQRTDVPETSYPGDVLRELEITARMCDLPGGGFIDFLGAYITKGKYPSVLLDQWWSYKRSLGSASTCPDRFGDEQRYALIPLSDGGVDLEMFKFDTACGWRQAAGVFWQTVDALARAEAWTSFEHRDLHEGQILIAPAESSPSSSSATPNYLSPEFTGARSTIIDFGLSRLDLPSPSSSRREATWSAFPPEVYEGKGEQWDVYRAMRDTIGSDWAGFHTETNILWLRYIARYLLHRTSSLRRPKMPNTPRSRRARAPRKSDLVDQAVLDAYACLLKTEELLGSAEHGMKSAADLMAWGRQHGWLG